MFKNDSDYRNIEAFYFDLRTKGVDFPIYNKPDYDSLIQKQIESKKKTQDVFSSSESLKSLDYKDPSDKFQRQSIKKQMHVPTATSSKKRVNGVVKLNEEQMLKISHELSIVESNVQVFNEVLSDLQSRNNKDLQYDSTQEVTLLKVRI